MGRTKRRRKNKIKKCEDEESYNDVIRLQEWIQLKNFRMKVVEFEGAGRGVIANRNISAGQELLAVPLACMITLNVVNKSELARIFKKQFNKPQVAIALFLVLQRHMGELSSYRKYIKVLPTSFSNLLSCSNVEVDALPVWVQRMVKNKLSDVKDSFRDALEHLDDSMCSHCDKRMSEIINYNDFLWAWSAVNTRGVYYEDDCTTADGEVKSTASMAMAPFLDFYNHSNDADVEAKLDIQRGVYSLMTKKPFGKYEQIFIKYGAYSNLRLLIEYGFILDDLDQDVVEFTFEEILKAAKNVDHSYADISKLKYKFITMNSLNTNLNKSKDEFSWNCNGLLYILVTQDTNLADILSKTYSSSWSDKEELVMKAIRLELVGIKEEVLLRELLTMEKVEEPSQGFTIAKSLVKQYLRILHE